jgi:hypothetical protein
VALAALLLAGCAEDGKEGGGAAAGSFASVSQAFSSESCTGCHPNLHSPDLASCSALVSQSATTVSGTLIVPNDVANSVVYEVAEGTIKPGGGATPMKFKNAADVTALEDWINNGAPCS